MRKENMKTRTSHKIIKLIALAAVFGATFLPSAVFADEPTWGPTERDTYTMANPAGYAAFNSITDNPTLGDERKFVRVAHIPSDCDKETIDYSKSIEGATPSTGSECVLEFKQSVEVEPGEQYMVYIYYHNNASSTYNTSTYDVRGVAKNVKMFSDYPDLILGERGEIEARIEYRKKHEDTDGHWYFDDNSTNVWAKAYLTNSDREQIALSYVAGSGRHYNVGRMSTAGNILPLSQGHESDPMVLAKKNISDSIFTNEGIYLGFADGINDEHEFGFGDGYVFGCEPFHGIVTYVLQATGYRGEVDKKVSVDGNTYTESVTVEPGATVNFLVSVKNTGQTALTHVILDDTLPEGLALVPGSVELSREGSSTWDRQEDSDIYALGTIGSGQTVKIRYKAKAGTNFDCTGRIVVNTAKITYDGITSAGITDEDQASVTVRKTGAECDTEDPKMILRKAVSINNGKTVAENAVILPGETAIFAVALQNTGTTAISNIRIKDTLPEGLTLVKKDASIVYTDDKGMILSGKTLSEDENILDQVIATLEPGNVVLLSYRVQAGEDFDCTGKELTNFVEATVGSKKVTADAKVTVKKSAAECPEPNCKTNPEMEGCEELPETGPMEIAIFSMIVVGITGGTIYLIMAKRTLKKMTDSVMNDPTDEGSSQNL